MHKIVANKSFLRIFIVLLIVVILMFFLNYLFLNNSIKLMNKQVKDNNRLVASGIIQSFDDSFQDIYNLVYSIDILPYKFTTNKNEEYYNNYLIYKSLNKLVSSSASSDYIEEVVVYNESSENAITSKGTIDIEAIFNKYYRNSQYNYVFWNSFFNDSHQLKVFPARKYVQLLNDHNVGEKDLIVVAGNIHRSLNNIMIFIDVKKLLKGVSQNGKEEISFAILDQDNHVILNPDEDINLVDVVNEIYVGEGKERFINNQEYEYIVYKSNYNGFTYINRLPFEDTSIMSIAKNHRKIMLFSIILAILLISLLSFYLFRPNIKIKRLIGGDSSWENIYITIINLKKEKELYESKVILTDLEIRKNSFLYAIGQNKDRNDLNLQMKDYVHDFFLDRKFLLINFSVASKKDYSLLQNISMKDLKEKIKNELDHIIKNTTIFHIKDGEFLVLVGIHASADRDKVIQAIKQFMRKIENEQSSDLFSDCHVTASISSAYDSNINNLQTAYQTIADIPFYRNIDYTTQIYDMESVRYTKDMYFPTEKIDKLSNLLNSGNGSEAIAIINQIIQRNIEMKIQYYQFVVILQSLIMNMKRHLNLNDDKQQVLYTLELELFNHARRASNLEVIEKSFMKIVEFISRNEKEDKEGNLNRVFIAEYIELHYMESLYLEHMASITNTSPKYFSKYFKKTFGVNFVEYLNLVRINRAKEFLKNENNTVSEVGEKTGFMHATTFSSTFKRFTGITPTQYRNKHIDGK